MTVLTEHEKLLARTSFTSEDRKKAAQNVARLRNNAEEHKRRISSSVTQNKPNGVQNELEIQYNLARNARFAGVAIDELIEARKKVNNIKLHSKGLFREEPINWATLYAFLENETNDSIPLADYLNNCVIDTKKQDLDIVVEEIKKYLNKQRDKNSQDYKDLNACYLRIQEDKNAISPKEIPLVTMTASRALFKACNPDHHNNDAHRGINIQRGISNSNQISRQSWGKILGGLFLAAIVFTFTAGLPLFQTGRKEKKIGNDLNRMFKFKSENVKEKEGVLYSPVTDTPRSLVNR